ncbi:ABC-three component system middle component 6 [Providencia sp. PROV169]|uniref:ABC-three component system middle component 6 n=1 Tax=Providencia sp. PROV169 TaxID=2949875 RepID=UPI00234ABCD7|nr:ABC-three component system middle component 6 [Providencia sp. PROV169]
MGALFSKNENLDKSPPVVGAEILRVLQNNDSGIVSIFDLAKTLRDKNKIGIKSLYFGVLFLYSLGIVDFDEPYVIKNVDN